MTAAGGPGPRSDEQGLWRLEAEVQAELAVADATPALGLFDPRESEWLVDPAEVQSEQTGLRSLLGALRALEAPWSVPDPQGPGA